MKNPLLHISDPHFHAHKSHATIVNGSNSRLQDIKKAVYEAAKIGKSRGVEIMVISGDIFHVRGSLKTSVFNETFALFKSLAREGWNFVMIPGNHDMEDYKGGHTGIDMFETINGCYVMQGRGFARLSLRGWDFLGIPYIHKVDEFKETFKEAHAANHDIDENTVILIHQYVDEYLDPSIPKFGLTKKWLEANTPGKVFSGHYHNPCEMGRVVNVGAPIQHNFKDEGTKRGCWINDGNDVEFIPIDVTPKFVTIESKRDLKSKGVDGNFVRVKVKTLATAKKLRDEALDGGALDVSIQVEKKFVTAHEKTVAINADPRKMIKDYMDMFPEKFGGKENKTLEMYEKICF